MYPHSFHCLSHLILLLEVVENCGLCIIFNLVNKKYCSYILILELWWLPFSSRCSSTLLHFQIRPAISIYLNLINNWYFLSLSWLGIFCFWICPQNCYFWKDCWFPGLFICICNLLSFNFCTSSLLGLMFWIYRRWFNTLMQQLLEKLEMPWMEEVSQGPITISHLNYVLRTCTRFVAK